MIETKNICLLIAILVFISFSGVGFADENSSIAVQTLYAGQHIEAGTVNVSNDSEYLYITFETIDDWVILETHLEVANNSSTAIPVTKNGNAIPGHFTYKNESLPDGTTIDEYVIPLETYLPAENGTLYIAAHAVVSNGTAEEGAWANGTRFNDNNWAGYFTYDISENEDGSGGITDGDDGAGDDGAGDDGTGDDGAGDDGAGDDGAGDDGAGDDGAGDDGAGDDGTGDDGAGDDGTGDDGAGDDGTGDDGAGDDGTGDDSAGDDGTGDDGTGDDGTGDDGAGDDGTGDDGAGDDGAGDDNSKKSGGSSSSVSYRIGVESSDEDNKFFSTPYIEEEVEPEISIPESVPEPVEQEPVAPEHSILRSILWYIIWILLSAICVMSGYGLTQP